MVLPVPWNRVVIVAYESRRQLKSAYSIARYITLSKLDFSCPLTASLAVPQELFIISSLRNIESKRIRSPWAKNDILLDLRYMQRPCLTETKKSVPSKSVPDRFWCRQNFFVLTRIAGLVPQISRFVQTVDTWLSSTRIQKERTEQHHTRKESQNNTHKEIRVHVHYLG